VDSDGAESFETSGREKLGEGGAPERPQPEKKGKAGDFLREGSGIRGRKKERDPSVSDMVPRGKEKLGLDHYERSTFSHGEGRKSRHPPECGPSRQREKKVKGCKVMTSSPTTAKGKKKRGANCVSLSFTEPALRQE